jgi:hypothetical protein
MSDEKLIEDVIQECDSSFRNYDVTGYNRIILTLSDVKNKTKAVDNAIRLAKCGPTLSSPRFAYPHIKDALLTPAD